jgi:hypothetical protein
MKLKFDDIADKKYEHIDLIPITLENIHLLGSGGEFGIKQFYKLLRKCPDLCEGYMLPLINGRPVGYIWVMFKGGNNRLYRIRKINTYIYIFSSDF